jgi:hypothetical protein
MSNLGPRTFGCVLALAALTGGAADAQIRFVDVAAQAGITLLNVSGTPAKDFVVDANGNGAAFFDYDNDRDLDVKSAAPFQPHPVCGLRSYRVRSTGVE